MPYSNFSSQRRQIESVRRQFGQADGLPFDQVLSAEQIEEALRAENVSWREIVFTPVVTLWAFLSQMMDPDSSCRAAVARVLGWLVANQQPTCSPHTDPYCKARQRLPEGLLQRLTRQTGRRLSNDALNDWRWKQRRVKVVDGSTVSMPDTPENQAAYPQSRTQKPGVGFPIARIVVVFCLACGTVIDAALGPYKGKKTGETALLRGLHDAFEPGDVLLADRGFSGYWDLARCTQGGVDFVVRQNQHRHTDFRTGTRLGTDDHLIVLKKPKQRPDWMDKETHQGMPNELTLREVRVRVAVPGFRSQIIDIVTSLLDAETYTKADLAELYRARWHAELDLRNLKVTLGMDVLRCKSPAMVRKEFWTHLLAYNLVRTVMAQAAHETGLLPREISFKATVQGLRAMATYLECLPEDRHMDIHLILWGFIANHQVMNRPDRVEPRKIKRRPKSYRLLNVPRREAQAALRQAS